MYQLRLKMQKYQLRAGVKSCLFMKARKNQTKVAVCQLFDAVKANKAEPERKGMGY